MMSLSRKKPQIIDQNFRRQSGFKVAVLILDFGSQFTQLIARAIRNLRVYCEIIPYNSKPNIIPNALILSGGPNSVLDWSYPTFDLEIYKDIPVLGICYGMQLISKIHSGKVMESQNRQYGFSKIKILDNSDIFYGFKKYSYSQVWMSHGDSVKELPKGATLLASSKECKIAAMRLKNFYAVQFHPEVAHTVCGKKIFSNFLFRVARLKPSWRMGDFLSIKSTEIRQIVANKKVLGAVSGGVDSTVLAVFLSKILGKNFYPVFVDTGLLRYKECENIKNNFKLLGINCHIINAQNIFLSRLKGITCPEKKRKIIGKTFIDVLEKKCKSLGNIEFLAQGTLYPDVIESKSVKGPSSVIKSHHNVGGLPKRMKLKILEPFKELFKDEVRILGKKLKIPKSILMRHPFPGPGLAVRIIGSIDEKKLEILRQVDRIFVDELIKRRLYNNIWQAFAVLLSVKSVGVMGDKRTYEFVTCLRAVTSRDGMTADWYDFKKDDLKEISTRIINEVHGINRVVYDVSSKPPATIEWL